jgi:hypothetical protein
MCFLGGIVEAVLLRNASASLLKGLFGAICTALECYQYTLGSQK